MLDIGIQVPCGVPYPGWELYHTPYDGRVYQPTKPYAVNGPSSESSPENCAACPDDKGNVKQPSSTENKKGEGGDRDIVEIPGWARDINGYYWCLKAMSGSEFIVK